MGKAAALAGERFGRLTVLARRGSKTYPGGYTTALWLCKCDCGTELTVNARDLTTESTRSCGCLRRENSSIMRKTGVSGRRMKKELFRRIVALRTADHTWDEIEKMLEVPSRTLRRIYKTVTDEQVAKRAANQPPGHQPGQSGQ